MPCLLILENAPSAEARHASLREGLRRMLGTPVEVVYDTLGKPSLVGDTPLRYLSVTTTGSYMVAALAETPLGIDGERRDRFTPDRTARLLAAADRFFTAADASFVRADPRRFGEVWVRREAYAKYTGRGIRAFPEFSVSDGNALLAEVNGVRIEPLAVPLPDADAYFFAVAGGRKP